MKAKDLMIGDWVLVERPDGSIDYAQVTVLKKDQFPDECCNLKGTLQFVPLTEEILQKHFPDPDEITWFPLDEKPGYFNIYWEHPTFGDGELRLNIRYVHELQHILTMLNINKEITL